MEQVTGQDSGVVKGSPDGVQHQTSAEVGASHYANFQRSGEYNCLSGSTSGSYPVQSTGTANVNFVCVDEKGTWVSPPKDCTAQVNVFAGYSGSARSFSDSMWVCPIGKRNIQVSASDEVNMQVGDKVLFSKGVVVTTGNSITTHTSFQLTANAGASAKDGASANIGISVGVTYDETDDFGDKTNTARGQAQQTFPVTNGAAISAIMQTAAQVQINGEGRVWGTAEAWSDAWMICMVGTSTNCGMSNVGSFTGAYRDSSLFNGYKTMCKQIAQSSSVAAANSW